MRRTGSKRGVPPRGFRFVSRALATALLALCGCGGTGDLPAGPRIAVVLDPDPEFWKTVHAGAGAAAKTLDAVILRPDASGDALSDPEGMIERLLGEQVQGLLVGPVEGAAAGRLIEAACEAGIPTVALDAAPLGGRQVSLVGTDHYARGEIAARHLGALLGGRGRVLVLAGVGSGTSAERCARGFAVAMQSVYPGVEATVDDGVDRASVEAAYRACRNAFARSARYDAVFAPSGPATLGVLRALQSAQLAGDLRFVGCDGGAESLAALRAGELDALVVQDAFHIGEVGLETLLTHLRGRRPRVRIDTGARLLTAQDLADADHPSLDSGQ